jgi:NADPH:quinone reductase-like Zn-dependent oxidoreductase
MIPAGGVRCGFGRARDCVDSFQRRKAMLVAGSLGRLIFAIELAREPRWHTLGTVGRTGGRHRGHDGVFKAIDCVSGQVGADVSRALAPRGELVVYGALSTHRQTDSDKLTIPIFARSLIYETKTVRGFWLFRWFTETPKDRMAAAIDRTVQLADSGVLRVPEGQPVPVEKFSEAIYLAEAPAHGGKPLLVFGP